MTALLSREHPVSIRYHSRLKSREPVASPPAAVLPSFFAGPGRDSTRHELDIQVATPSRGSTQRINTM
jgi:hypothetical protein